MPVMFPSKEALPEKVRLRVGFERRETLGGEAECDL